MWGSGSDRADSVLRGTTTVVVVDWPSRDVPGALASAGLRVFVKSGPGPADYTVWETRDGQVVSQPYGRVPGSADLVYAYRPLSELPGIARLAQSLGAKALWRQSGLADGGGKAVDGCWLPPGESQRGREIAEAAGLAYIDDVYIADAARRYQAWKTRPRPGGTG
jgi:predicted CoA-binding protein